MKMSDHPFTARPISLLKEKARLVWIGGNERAADHPFLLVAAFATVFLGMLMYGGRYINDPFYHDSYQYWELGSSFYKTGHFSFLNFSDELRGYFFPFILSLPQSQGGWLGMETKAWFTIYSAFFFAIFTLLLVPWFLRRYLIGKRPF